MEIFIFLISIGIVVLFAVFALGYNLGRSNTEYEYELKASAKGEFCIDSNSGILYFHSNDGSNTVVANVDREGSN